MPKNMSRDVLVIGAGIAGMQTALLLAEKEHRVYILENAPAIGGLFPLLDRTFPNWFITVCHRMSNRFSKLINNYRINYSRVTSPRLLSLGKPMTNRQPIFSIRSDACNINSFKHKACPLVQVGWKVALSSSSIV